ncbi:MAG TPA: hypothetical protein VJL28_00560 [Gemmatimonadaceae bacterium]|nr:hypothetical protein [Gemmatimonadaceae bacterium]
MGLLNRLSSELRGVGKAARGALDEGKVRIELFRVRQLADKAAQAVGYAVHRARAEGKDPDPAELQRLESKLTEHETEAHRLEEELRQHTATPSTPPKP